MLMLAYGRGRWAVSQRRIMILESQPAWQAIPHEFVGKVGTRAKEWNEGRRGRVREGNTELISDRMKGGGGGLEKETQN